MRETARLTTELNAPELNNTFLHSISFLRVVQEHKIPRPTLLAQLVIEPYTS
jgi:hypothetical protein